MPATINAWAGTDQNHDKSMIYYIGFIIGGWEGDTSMEGYIFNQNFPRIDEVKSLLTISPETMGYGDIYWTNNSIIFNDPSSCFPRYSEIK